MPFGTHKLPKAIDIKRAAPHQVGQEALHAQAVLHQAAQPVRAILQQGATAGWQDCVRSGLQLPCSMVGSTGASARAMHDGCTTHCTLDLQHARPCNLSPCAAPSIVSDLGIRRAQRQYLSRTAPEAAPSWQGPACQPALRRRYHCCCRSLKLWLWQPWSLQCCWCW